MEGLLLLGGRYNDLRQRRGIGPLRRHFVTRVTVVTLLSLLIVAVRKRRGRERVYFLYFELPLGSKCSEEFSHQLWGGPQAKYTYEYGITAVSTSAPSPYVLSLAEDELHLTPVVPGFMSPI